MWFDIGHEFYKMIVTASASHGLQGECEVVGNWRPISLLNASYKSLAKALQSRMQPVLLNVISSN